MTPSEAFEFCRDRARDWGRINLVSAGTADRLAAYFQRAVNEAADWPVPAALPIDDTVLATAIQRWQFLAEQLPRAQNSLQLPLAEYDRCEVETRQRLAFLNKKAAAMLPAVRPTPPPAEPTPVAEAPPPVPRRPLIEILLDPQSIQWFLALGGALLVFGLVLYLYAVGIFENPLIVAVAMGVANAAALAGGAALVTRTRYQLAGKALTLLACLVMPLNLWFYHAQDLVTLQGKLWVAASIVTAIYAAVALALRDEAFVPVFLGGVTMTGLLLLIDLDRFWEVLTPATFLVGLGLAAVHVERAFGPGDGPFSRRRFGRAFFFSGQVLLAAGLLFLLAAQVTGDWLYELQFKPYYDAYERAYQMAEGSSRPALATDPTYLMWALGLVIAGIYSCVYSDLVVRRVGTYLHAAALGVLWAAVLVLRIFVLELGFETVVALIGLAGTGATVAARMPSASSRLTGLVGVVLTAFSMFGAVRFYGEGLLFRGGAEARFGPTFLALVVLVMAYRASAYFAGGPRAATFFWIAAALAKVAAASVGLRWLGVADGMRTALLVLVPLAQAVAAHFYKLPAITRPMVTGSRVVAGLLVATAFLRAGFAQLSGGWIDQSWLALAFALLAAYYILLSLWHGERQGVLYATVLVAGAFWQVLAVFDAPEELHFFTFAATGLALLAAYRVAAWEKSGQAHMARPAFECGNGLLTAMLVAGAWLAVGRLAEGTQWRTVGLNFGLAVAALAGTALVGRPNWQRFYLVLAVVHVALGVLTAGVMANLTAAQKLEIVCVVAGIVFLSAGLAGRAGEHERESETTGFALFLGSFLIALPILLAVIGHRSGSRFHWPDEIGLLVGGIVLLGIGLVGELKSPSIAGGLMVGGYVLTLPLFAVKLLEQVQTAALVMAVVGGTVFTFGLVLALCRDRLLALPDQVRQQRGVFRVLGWR